MVSQPSKFLEALNNNPVSVAIAKRRLRQELNSEDAYKRLNALDKIAARNSPDDIDILADKLAHDGAPLLRSKAATIIGTLPPEVAQPVLLAGLNIEGDHNVLNAIIDATASVREDPQIERALINIMHSCPHYVSSTCIGQLAASQSPSALDALFAAMSNDTMSSSHVDLIEAVKSRSDDPRLLPILGNMMISQDSIETQNNAFGAAMEVSPQQTVELLINNLHEKRGEFPSQRYLSTAGQHAVAPLIQAIEAEPERTCFSHFSNALGDITAPAAEAELVAAMAHLNLRVQAAAATALGHIKGDSALAVPALLQAALNSDDSTVHQNAMNALIKRDPDRAQQASIDVLDREESSEVQQINAMRTLAVLSQPTEFFIYPPRPARSIDVDPIIARLSNDDPSVRVEAAKALEEIDDKKAVEPLIARLEDPDTMAQHHSIAALGKLKAKEAVEPLIALLDEPNQRINHDTTIRALGEIGDPRAVDPLIRIAESPDNPNMHDIVVALNAIGDSKASATLARVVRNPELENYIRTNAAGGLKKMGDRSSIPSLILALSSDNQSLLVGVTEAIGKLGANDAIEPLLDLITLNDNYDVKQAAATALITSGGAVTTIPLLRLMDHDDENVRRIADRTLDPLVTNATVIEQMRNDPQYLPVFTHALKSSREEIRNKATYVLGDIGTVESVLPLIEILRTRNEPNHLIDRALDNIFLTEPLEELVTIKDPRILPVVVARIHYNSPYTNSEQDAKMRAFAETFYPGNKETMIERLLAPSEYSDQEKVAVWEAWNTHASRDAIRIGPINRDLGSIEDACKRIIRREPNSALGKSAGRMLDFRVNLRGASAPDGVDILLRAAADNPLTEEQTEEQKRGLLRASDAPNQTTASLADRTPEAETNRQAQEAAQRATAAIPLTRDLVRISEPDQPADRTHEEETNWEAHEAARRAANSRQADQQPNQQIINGGR